MGPPSPYDEVLSKQTKISNGQELSLEEDVEMIRGMHLREPAFRALVEENVKANVWRLMRSRVIQDVSLRFIYF